MNFKRILGCLAMLTTSSAFALPEGFVYLQDVAPTIQQDIRYVGYHNVLGRPMKGYQGGACILTHQAAEKLAEVQKELLTTGHSLKVYDCYRPTIAVDDIMEWSKDPTKQQMKAEFYPNVDKADLFKLGYVAEKSGHCRGSTVDLTIVPVPTPKQPSYYPGDKLTACFAPYGKRYHDNSIDMGTGYDCMDVLSHPDNKNITSEAYTNRMMLRQIMAKHGFKPLAEEWWHFTLKDEPYPEQYYDFPVVTKS